MAARKRGNRRTRCKGCKKLYGSGVVQNGLCGRCTKKGVVSTTNVGSKPTPVVPSSTKTREGYLPRYQTRPADNPLGRPGCHPSCVAPPGASGCHCTVCHETLGTVGGFDAHRTNGKCVSVPGLVKRRGFWATEEDHDSREAFAARVARS